MAYKLYQINDYAKHYAIKGRYFSVHFEWVCISMICVEHPCYNSAVTSNQAIWVEQPLKLVTQYYIDSNKKFRYDLLANSTPMLLAEKKPISNKKVICCSLHSKLVLIAGIDINL